MYYSQLEKSWMESRISPELLTLLSFEVSTIVSPPPTTMSSTTIPPLHDFIDLIVRKSHTRTGTLLVALILLNRLSYRLGHVATTGLATAPQRIFLASLIISTKLVHDTSPKNKHWLSFTNDYFALKEVNLMEKQFLTLMDFNLSISDQDFQQVVDRYKQVQKDGRRNRKSKRWQASPECFVTPNRNVALSKNDTTLTKPTLPCSLSSSSIASTSSTLSTMSSSSTLSSSSSSCSPLVMVPLNDDVSNNNNNNYHHHHHHHHHRHRRHHHTSFTCDDNGSNWCHPTRYISPLFSV